THQLSGMATAFRLAQSRLAEESAHARALHARLWAGLQQLSGVFLNGDPQRRTGHILNVSVAGVEGESLLHALDGLAVASGSACASASREPSYVLRLLGRSPVLAGSSVRFSFGRGVTLADIDTAADIFATAVQALRRHSPAWPRPAGPSPEAGGGPAPSAAAHTHAGWSARGEA